MKKEDFIGNLTDRVQSLNKIVVSNRNKEDKPSLYFSYSYDTVLKLFTRSEIEEYNSLVNSILSWQNYRQVFSSNYLERKINSILHKTFDNPEIIPSEIEAFYSELNSNSSDEWFVISEVDNIELSSTSIFFKIINSTFKYLMKNDLPFDIKLINVGNSVPNISDYIMKPCIFTTVTAGDRDKAISLAFNNFDQSFNLLKVFSPNSRPSIKGNYPSPTHPFFSYNMKNESGTHHFSHEKNEIFGAITLKKDIN